MDRERKTPEPTIALTSVAYLKQVLAGAPGTTVRGPVGPAQLLLSSSAFRKWNADCVFHDSTLGAPENLTECGRLDPHKLAEVG